MTKERAKQLWPIFKHWANNGNLWWYNAAENIWVKYDKAQPINIMFDSPTYYVIEDEFFEARKAKALGKSIEIALENSEDWMPVTSSHQLWMQGYKYREKPEWYLDNSNINKVIMVRDDESDNWIPTVFKGYISDTKFSAYKGIAGARWAFARPLKANEVVLEEEV